MADWSVDKCVAGSCSAEDECAAGLACEKAFDDTNNTMWANTTADNSWLLYDFGVAVSHAIRKLTMMNSSVGGDRECAPRKFKIRADNNLPADKSADGVLLHEVDEAGDYWDEGNQETKEWTWNNLIEYRYVWVYMTDKQGAFGRGCEFVIAEISMHTWIGPIFKLSGTIKEKGSPVIRVVRAYTRSTGVLYSSSQSLANGTFELPAPDGTTDMFVVAFDHDPTPQYNDLIYGRVKAILT